jgi:hypothetical protein
LNIVFSYLQHPGLSESAGNYARVASESFTSGVAEEAVPPQVWQRIPSWGDRLDENLLIAQRFCLALGMHFGGARTRSD